MDGVTPQRTRACVSTCHALITGVVIVVLFAYVHWLHVSYDEEMRAVMSELRDVRTRLDRLETNQQPYIATDVRRRREHRARNATTKRVIAHFHGDMTHVPFLETHEQRLQVDGRYRHWRASNWMSQHARVQLRNGSVCVHDAGVYYAYAQVYYVDRHEMNGYVMLHNEQPVTHCTSTSTTTLHAKSCTCFTAIALRLHAHDCVALMEMAGRRLVMFDDAKTFMGLIRLDDL